MKLSVQLSHLKYSRTKDTLPFPISGDGYIEINEESRMQYRYLDIRRSRMLQNLKLRSKILSYIRHYLSEHHFTEVDTPILTKTSPEGARDFIVPSRLQPGKFCIAAVSSTI